MRPKIRDTTVVVRQSRSSRSSSDNEEGHYKRQQEHNTTAALRGMYKEEARERDVTAQLHDYLPSQCVLYSVKLRDFFLHENHMGK